MIQVDNFKRPSPSPSRSSVRSDSRVCRQPRVIQVNRDASTMMDEDEGGCAAPARGSILISDWEPCGAQNFRSRTFSDGFIRNTSLELLLGVDCEACIALANQSQCHDKRVADQNFDLVCNCNIQQNNYVNCNRNLGSQRGHTLNIYDLDTIKRERAHLHAGSHRSLDRKHTKSKTIGVSNYISKQLISYDPTNTIMQKLKRKLCNLKKMGSEAVSKKHQNAAVQLAEITSASSSSLKKLSMLSLVDAKSQRRFDNQNCNFSSASYQPKSDCENNITTYANFSGNVDQCFDRLRDCSGNADMNRRMPLKLPKMRSFDNNEEIFSKKSPAESIKFSTLDNRSRCRNIRRQMSYNEFPSERFRDRSSEWGRDENKIGSRTGVNDLLDDDAQTFVDADVTMLGASRATLSHCTCHLPPHNTMPSIFYDAHGKKRAVPAPDVTERVSAHAPAPACAVCKAQWQPTTRTASTTSHSSNTTGNSSRFTVWHRRWCCVAILVLVAGTACVAGPLALRAPPGAPLHERLRLAERLLHETPLIDGHNDLPWNIRKFLHNKIKDFRFDEDLRTISPWATSSWSHTDLPRLKQGRVAAQFWAAYVPCDAQHRDAVQLTFEQIDLIQRLTEKYHPQLTLCTSAEDIVAAHANHRVCSLIGVEGGHAVGGSLGVLRTLHQVGVRYLTLTSTCDTPWAESASNDRPHAMQRGLTPFGKVIIKEMNRLGMLVDLSHVSEKTMRDALAVSRAPVLFSHSSARALCNVTRNVPDSVLRLLAANKGLIMVNFYTSFLTCKETATVQDAIAHINHIREVAGVDNVGLGAGYDGINYTPQGLEDVSSYPLLFAELMEEGWSMEDLRKLAGLNLLRVLGAAEKVSKELASANVIPYEEVAPRLPDQHNCSSQDL